MGGRPVKRVLTMGRQLAAIGIAGGRLGRPTTAPRVPRMCRDVAPIAGSRWNQKGPAKLKSSSIRAKSPSTPRVRKAEVRGSIPLGSTNKIDSVVGLLLVELNDSVSEIEFIPLKARGLGAASTFSMNEPVEETVEERHSTRCDEGRILRRIEHRRVLLPSGLRHPAFREWIATDVSGELGEVQDSRSSQRAVVSSARDGSAGGASPHRSARAQPQSRATRRALEQTHTSSCTRLLVRVGAGRAVARRSSYSPRATRRASARTLARASALV